MHWVKACTVGLLLLPPPADAQPAPAATQQPAAAIADEYIHRAWGTADGLPQNSVTVIAQTRDGYLWVGTFGGLVRFDGNTFTVFDPGNTPGLLSARITALSEGANGVLWIGTESGLSRFENGHFTSYPMPFVASVFEDRKGRVWVGGNNGLHRFENGIFTAFALGPISSVAVSFAETPDGDLWVATWHGVARIDVNGRSAIAMVAHDSFVQLFVDRTGRLWAHSRRIWRWDGTAFAEAQLPHPPMNASHRMAEDPGGHLWLGTNGNGVYRWREGRVDVYNTAAGLTDDNARAILADRDGNIWIGTNVGGLNRLKHRRARSYPRHVLEESIGPITDDGADGLWVGGTCGGLFHFRAGRFRVLTQEDGLPSNCIWALLRAGETLWIGSGSGVTKYEHGRFTTLTADAGLLSNEVQAIARDRAGVLWIGTDQGLSRFDGRHFTNYRIGDGLEHDVRTILPDRAGALWLGGTNGLTRFADGTFTRWTTAQGLAHGQVRAIHEDADGTLWIGTYGGGLNRFRDGRFTTYTIKDGLHDNAVSRIIDDDRGNLWMSGNKGVYRVARSELNAFAEGRLAYITSVSYGMADGMIIDETNGGQPAGWRGRDGTMWFPTIKGLVGIEPDRAAATAPPVFVERVVSGGQAIDAAALGSLGPGRVDAEFHYTAVDLSAAEKTRFKYRLDGYDRDWIDGGSRRVAYYTNIPPGAYRFDVIATSSDGAWGTAPAGVALTVTPLWWQRGAVQFAALALLLTATGAAVRHVSLRRARARLAEFAREQALDRERSRIARDLHDDLGSRLAQIKLIADREQPDTLGRISEVAGEAMQTMDELVWAVNARNDSVESFAQYVAEFLDEHLSAAGLRHRLQLPADFDDRPLNADARRHLFLGVKETVHNVVKHARASEVRVRVDVDDNHLVVEVTDNGRGFVEDQAAAGTGNGLRNLRERAAATGGTVRIDSRPDTGTTVMFRVPLAR